MNNYLIPANSKKSMLYFGLFNSTDLWIFGSGIIVTFLLLMILPVEELVFAIIAIAPATVCSFLVLPVPNYHNVRTFIKSFVTFIRSDKKIHWKGWCLLDGDEQKY